MSELQSWLSQPDGMNRELNWLLSSSQPLNPHPAVIEAESWQLAEEATHDIIQRIQPTVVSEHRRRAVVEYVQRLIKESLSIEVFPFGSVPLKTYLPDGDIDLTSLGTPGHEDTLAAYVRDILEYKEQNKDVDFEIKDVQYIHAEVKLVKCLVRNIVVDISFNQIGGLCTLCFLEKVDQIIGKDHLFKRSIILIKAWCYYESRILGAHHGLISTYALETLVLYIFHLFHSSLDGPLAVLYRFLDYYSKFDWDNYCVSINGPIPISSLPELAAEAPENGGDLLLPKEFLRYCVDTFSVPSRGLENHSRAFLQKHLNIVDTLRENNNLGRSVSKGNFYRIRSAFAYGARKLGSILSSSKDCIADEISDFFMNTLDRHGSGVRPDVQDEFFSQTQEMSEENNAGSMNLYRAIENGVDRLSFPLLASPREEASKLKHLHFEEDPKLSIPVVNQWQKFRKWEANGIGERVSLEKHLVDDSSDPPSRYSSTKINDGTTLDSSPSTSESLPLPYGKPYVPHHFFSPRNGPRKQGGNNSSNGSAFSEEDNSFSNWLDSQEAEFSVVSQNVDFSSGGDGGNSVNENRKNSDVSDLDGDYESHWANLRSALHSHKSLSNGLSISNHRLSPPYRYRYKPSSTDIQKRQNIYPHMGANGVIPGPPIPPVPYYPINPHLLSGMYGADDMAKPRGTGTYFPNTSFQMNKERHSPRAGRNPAPLGNGLRNRNNGWTVTPDANFADKGSHEQLRQPQSYSSAGNGRDKVALDPPQASRPLFKGAPPPQPDWFAFPTDGRVEFGTFGSILVGPSSDMSKRLDSASPRSQNSGSSSNTRPLQKSSGDTNHERPVKSYELKDEEDFPPLSG